MEIKSVNTAFSHLWFLFVDKGIHWLIVNHCSSAFTLLYKTAFFILIKEICSLKLQNIGTNGKKENPQVDGVGV